jgi:serine/threonine protein kinase
MNRCPSCRASYGDDALFCPQDGTRLVPVAPATPTSSSTAPRRRTEPPGRADDPSKAPPSHAALVGQLLDRRYQVEKKLGEGGMSFVYLGRDIASGERVAIKVLSAALSEDPNAMARLRREAALGMRLAHPNVCHIIRLGESESGLIYVVMPFVEGEILSDLTFKRGALSTDETLGFVRDIAAGLHFAHDLKIVHRDLKPENVMICRRPDGGEYAVVMDFGLAKERRADAELQKLTKTGIVLGTPEFMSPEQLRGKALDARSDVYALALMTYEMLTGKLPFPGRNQQEIMIARLRSEPLPLRELKPEAGFPEAMERVLLKALSRNPDDRYQGVVEFSEALTSAAHGGGIDSLLGKVFGN